MIHEFIDPRASPEYLEGLRKLGCRVRRVWKVTPQAISIPEWARKRAIRGLQKFEDSIWLALKDAKTLVILDQECGGRPLVTKTVFMFCPVCRRPLIGEDAELRVQTSLKSGMFGSKMPCGPECYPAARDKRWKPSSMSARSQ